MRLSKNTSLGNANQPPVSNASSTSTPTPARGDTAQTARDERDLPTPRAAAGKTIGPRGPSPQPTSANDGSASASSPPPAGAPSEPAEGRKKVRRRRYVDGQPIPEGFHLVEATGTAMRGQAFFRTDFTGFYLVPDRPSTKGVRPAASERPPAEAVTEGNTQRFSTASTAYAPSMVSMSSTLVNRNATSFSSEQRSQKPGSSDGHLSWMLSFPEPAGWCDHVNLGTLAGCMAEWPGKFSEVHFKAIQNGLETMRENLYKVREFARLPDTDLQGFQFGQNNASLMGNLRAMGVDNLDTDGETKFIDQGHVNFGERRQLTVFAKSIHSGDEKFHAVLVSDQGERSGSIWRLTVLRAQEFIDAPAGP